MWVIDTGAGWLNRQKRAERRQIGRKERGRRARCSGEQGTRTNLGGGERKGPHQQRRETYKLNIKGTESRETQANVQGTGSNQPIMDKLGIPVARPKEERKKLVLLYGSESWVVTGAMLKVL